MKPSVAIIGHGFVGSALSTVFAENGIAPLIHDQKTSNITLSEFARACNLADNFTGIFFVCVPTPLGQAGAADVSIVQKVLDELDETPFFKTVVIKSTVPPGTTAALSEKLKSIRLVFCPEFLRARSAVEDVRRMKRLFIGGDEKGMDAIERLYTKYFPYVEIIRGSSAEIEMLKYFVNINLAVRVVLSCEFKQVCEALDRHGVHVNYDTVAELAKLDPRIGGSHLDVPGPDGIAGARGQCFPKDLNAIIALAKVLGADPALMEAAWHKNLDIVPPEHRDWL